MAESIVSVHPGTPSTQTPDQPLCVNLSCYSQQNRNIYCMQCILYISGKHKIWLIYWPRGLKHNTLKRSEPIFRSVCPTSSIQGKCLLTEVAKHALFVEKLDFLRLGKCNIKHSRAHGNLNPATNTMLCDFMNIGCSSLYASWILD